jgi:hypothetical protein
VIVTLNVDVFGQGPLVVYVTVYVPIVLATRLMLPVVALMLSPAGDEVNVPPASPVIVGVGFVPV